VLALVLHDDAIGRMSGPAVADVRRAALGKMKTAKLRRDLGGVREAGQVLLAADQRLNALGIAVTGDRSRVTVDGERLAPEKPPAARQRPQEGQRKRPLEDRVADARAGLYGPEPAETDAGQRAAALAPQLEASARKLGRPQPTDPEAVADRADAVRKELGL